MVERPGPRAPLDAQKFRIAKEGRFQSHLCTNQIVSFLLEHVEGNDLSNQDDYFRCPSTVVPQRLACGFVNSTAFGQTWVEPCLFAPARQPDEYNGPEMEEQGDSISFGPWRIPDAPDVPFPPDRKA